MYIHYFNNTVDKLMQEITDEIISPANRRAIADAYHRNQFGLARKLLLPHIIDGTPVITKPKATVKIITEQLHEECNIRENKARIACLELISLGESDKDFVRRVNSGILKELWVVNTERAYRIANTLYDCIQQRTDKYEITEDDRAREKILRILFDIQELLWPIIDMASPDQNSIKPELRCARDSNAHFNKQRVYLSRAATIGELIDTRIDRMDRNVLLRVFENRPDHGGSNKHLGELMFSNGRCVSKQERKDIMELVRNRYIHNIIAVNAYDKTTILVYVKPDNATQEADAK